MLIVRNNHLSNILEKQILPPVFLTGLHLVILAPFEQDHQNNIFQKIT